MAVLKFAVVVAVVAGLTVNVWTKRRFRRKAHGAPSNAELSLRARSAAYGDALMIQCLAMVAAMLLGASAQILAALLAGVLLTVAAFWLRHRAVA